ncbi:MAG: MmgE/PrpD family protein, partial [bacterium]|nr:MmgE/PrpD family protein [bacterium]
MDSMARALVRELDQFGYCGFPIEVIDHTRLLFLDLLGVALGATHTPEAQGMLRAFGELGSINAVGSVLWGTPSRAGAGDAALYNGTLSHALELDDFGGADHSGAVIFPATLAVMNADKAIDGREFIEAVVTGYEVSRRLLEASGGYRAHNSEAGWHSTATCGAAGAAVAVGKLIGLNEDEMVSALGFATTMTGGTWAFNEDGAMSKRIHPGWAAELGVKSAFFARSGLAGPEFCLEAEWGGFFNTYAKGHATPELLLEDFGVKHKILRSGIKPYPCCRDNHSVVDIMLDVHQSLDGDLDKLEKVKIFCIPQMYKMLANRTPANTMQAQLSLPHCAAAALLHGK